MLRSDSRPDPDRPGVPMRVFSFRPALTLKGRTFKGLSGWSGKPLHHPLTDIPVAAYAALGVSVGSAYGGSLVYDYGFHVEAAGDHPAWHVSEQDRFPGES